MTLLAQFNFDERISVIANDEIPDARDRLQYVVDKTEVAANKTMDAVDRCMPIADNLHSVYASSKASMEWTMHGRIDWHNLKLYVTALMDYLSRVEGDSTWTTWTTDWNLTMAPGFPKI